MIDAPLDAAAPVVRYRLSQLFAAVTVVAILLWTIRSYQVFYESHTFVGTLGITLCAFVAILLAAPLLAVRRIRRPVCLLFLAVFVAFSIAQTAASRRLTALRREVNRIIPYLEDFKSTHGAYPSSLDGYKFEQPALAPFIRYDSQPRGWSSPYAIFWNPLGETSYGHYYTPDDGHWYEDD